MVLVMIVMIVRHQIVLEQHVNQNLIIIRAWALQAPKTRIPSNVYQIKLSHNGTPANLAIPVNNQMPHKKHVLPLENQHVHKINTSHPITSVQIVQSDKEQIHSNQVVTLLTCHHQFRHMYHQLKHINHNRLIVQAVISGTNIHNSVSHAQMDRTQTIHKLIVQLQLHMFHQHKHTNPHTNLHTNLLHHVPPIRSPQHTAAVSSVLIIPNLTPLREVVSQSSSQFNKLVTLNRLLHHMAAVSIVEVACSQMLQRGPVFTNQHTNHKPQSQVHIIMHVVTTKFLNQINIVKHVLQVKHLTVLVTLVREQPQLTSIHGLALVVQTKLKLMMAIVLHVHLIQLL